MTAPEVWIEFDDRLGESWRDLAEALEIPTRARRRFLQGDEAREIRRWLAERKLEERLTPALRAIARDDLAHLLDGAADTPPVAADATDFSALIDERTREFVGRRRFAERLWAALDDDTFRSGYLYVHGEPGIGKTALLAKLVRERDLVHHFNSALSGITSRERFLRNVCAQLVLRYQLPYTRLPVDAASDSGFLLNLLTRASGSGRTVVAVDAVDEAIATEGAQNRLFLPPALPPGVFFIVTMRHPDDVGMYVDESRDLPLLETDPENVADIREYISVFLQRNRRAMARRLHDLALTEQELGAAVADRSEGNFMYVRHILRAVRDDTLGGLGADGLDSLPRGLRAYYGHLEKQLTQRIDGDTERELAILGVLAVWPSPLAVRRLARYAGVGVAPTRVALRRWAPFLNQVTTDAGPAYALYHASFREFLAGRLDLSAVRGRIRAAVEGEPG